MGIVRAGCWGYVVERLGDGETRIQLCGRLVVRLNGARIEGGLPGRQGRLLFGYLATQRGRQVSREALTDALWPNGAPGSHDGALRPLLSKLRLALGPEHLEGRSDVRLKLPAGARIDVESAREGVHTAESAIALGRWKEAWLPARVGWSVSSREFMAGHEGEWIDERRGELEELHLRSLECIARTSLRLGPAELPAGERAARSLVKLAPYRESGYRCLMEILEARSNVAEALRVYEGARLLFRDELGIAPGRELVAAHTRLLQRV